VRSHSRRVAAQRNANRQLSLTSTIKEVDKPASENKNYSEGYPMQEGKVWHSLTHRRKIPKSNQDCQNEG